MTLDDLHDERREESNAEDQGERFIKEDQGVTFQAGPDPGAIRRQGWRDLLHGQPLGKRQEQTLATGHAADRGTDGSYWGVQEMIRSPAVSISQDQLAIASESLTSNHSLNDARYRNLDVKEKIGKQWCGASGQRVGASTYSYNHPDVIRLSGDIRKILALIRKSPKKIDDGPEHYRILDNQKDSSIQRAVIGIPTRGCSYARTPWGGCAVCGHVSSILWSHNIEQQSILSDFAKSLGSVLESAPEILCLYTSGSFLDESELSISVRNRILEVVADVPSIKAVAIESLPYYLSEQVLDDFARRLPGKKIRIGIGLDSSCSVLRSTLYQRAIPLSKYQAAVEMCKMRGISTTAYVVLGNPLLSAWGSGSGHSLFNRGCLLAWLFGCVNRACCIAAINNAGYFAQIRSL